MKASTQSAKPRGLRSLGRYFSAQRASAASQSPVSAAKKRNFALVMPM